MKCETWWRRSCVLCPAALQRWSMRWRVWTSLLWARAQENPASALWDSGPTSRLACWSCPASARCTKRCWAEVRLACVRQRHELAEHTLFYQDSFIFVEEAFIESFSQGHWNITHIKSAMYKETHFLDHTVPVRRIRAYFFIFTLCSPWDAFYKGNRALIYIALLLIMNCSSSLCCVCIMNDCIWRSLSCRRSLKSAVWMYFCSDLRKCCIYLLYVYIKD